MSKKSKKQALLAFYSQPAWLRVHQSLFQAGFASGFETVCFDGGRYRFPKVSLGIKTHNPTYSKPKTGKHIEFRDQEIEALYSSEFFTYFNSPKPTGFMSKLYLRISVARGRRFAQDFFSFLKTELPERVIIPNGRMGIHKIAVHVCRELGIPIVFVENNYSSVGFNNKYFFESFAIHDRVSRQIDLKTLTVDKSEAQTAFENWMQSRIFGSENQFSKKWKSAALPEDDSKKELNLFLNSSSDEHFALGDSWNVDSWDNQYQAFASAISLLESMGEKKFILRMHPNLISKSLPHVLEEISNVLAIKNRVQSLKIIGPLGDVNTYELMAHSKRVFVSVSKSGLESTGVGVPTWCTSANDFDLVADVRTLHGPEDLVETNLDTYSVDRSASHFYVHAMQQSGQEFVSEVPPPKNPRASNIMTTINGDLIFRTLFVASRTIRRSIVRILLIWFEKKLRRQQHNF